MNYDDALQYIESTLKFGSKPGLERINRLLGLMGDPQNSLKFVHIAGTNGKGSIANAISSVLKKSGIKTGLFISPYVTEFCERIQINGQYISHEELAEEVEHIKPFADNLNDHPTEFELITALAFNYFKKNGCDVVVLEVGLGGRFDATNVIKNPLVSVITKISYDHMNILGDTIRKIAFEKCGIIKSGGVTVTCPNQEHEALEVIMSECADKNNTLIIPSMSTVKIKYEDIGGTDIEYGKLKMHIPLAGRHQIMNFITAFEAVKALSRHGIYVKDDIIVDGMSEVKFPARMEILNKSPLVIIDGAHNPDGAQALASSIERYLNGKPVLIMGMLKDKEYEKAAAKLAPLAKAIIAVAPKSPRALPEYEMEAAVKKYCQTTYSFASFAEAFKKAVQLSESSPIVICGSLYLASEMRKVVFDYFNKTH